MNYSFRDPQGKVLIKKNKIFRLINYNENNFFKILFEKRWYKKIVKKKFVQEASYIRSNSKYAIYSHKKLIFPIFVNEFCAEQLYEAGKLTIKLAIDAFKNNYQLKDASAWNIAFDNSKPIFLDVTSFEKYNYEKNWLAYGQFCRHFIIPLTLHNELRIKISDLFIRYRDGIDPVVAKNLLGIKTIKTLSSIETILLPSLLNKSSLNEKFFNQFNRFNKEIYLNNILRLEKYLNKNRPKKNKSTWTNYEKERNHYSKKDLLLKKIFVLNCSKNIKGLILDLGCNTGQYSILLSKMTKRKIVSADYDDLSLNILQSELKKSNVTVCDINIANPSSAIGWDNKEHKSFLERAEKKFDLVISLGLLHHLIISERVPMEKIIKTFHTISKKYLLVEFICNQDEKFINIAKSNLYLYKNINQKNFESILKNIFIILKKQNLNFSKRTIYFLKKIN